MRCGPASCRNELVSVRTEVTQVLEVAAPRSLVHGRIELEANHVEATREPGDQTVVVVSLEAPDEPVRQAKIEQRLRPEIDPVAREPVGARDVDDRDPERAYLAWYADGVRLVDTRDPAGIFELALWVPPTDPQVWSVALMDDLVVVGDVNGGLYLLRR